MRKLAILLALAGFLSQRGVRIYLAQEVPTYELSEIVVTATKTQKELELAPGSISVITKDDIEKRNIKTVDGALNTSAGVFNIRTRGFTDTSAGVRLRGIPNFNRSLIMLDGMCLNDAFSGMVRFGGLQTDDVERIEVARGPFSSLYGGYAMGGVVNIITKMPQKREFTVKGEYGANNLEDIYFSYGNKFMDKLSLFLSYGRRTTDGYPAELNVVSSEPPPTVAGWTQTTDSQGNTRYLIGHKGNNKWWDDGITLKGEYAFSMVSKVNLSLMRNRFEIDYENPETYLEDASGNKVWSYTGVKEASFLPSWVGECKYTMCSNLGFETEMSDTKAKLSFNYSGRDYPWVIPGSLAAFTEGAGIGIPVDRADRRGSDLQFTTPYTSHIFTYGGSFNHEEAERTRYNILNWKEWKSINTNESTLNYQGKGKADKYALFLQDEVSLKENFTAYIGARMDGWKGYDGYVYQENVGGKNYEPRKDSFISPKLAVVYEPVAKTTLRTSVGNAFRTPGIWELYMRLLSGGITYDGNPDLTPEKTTSWDIGIKQEIWEGANGKVTYFENYMKDLIYRKTITSTYQIFTNAGRAESRGIELEAEQRFGTEFRLFTNYTYTDAEMKENPANPNTEGKKLVEIPETMVNVGTDFERGAFSTSLAGRYVSKRYKNEENKDTINNVYGSYDPYFVMDAKVSYRVTKFATLFLSVANIFDRDYFDDYKAPGRSWTTGLKMEF